MGWTRLNSRGWRKRAFSEIWSAAWLERVRYTRRPLFLWEPQPWRAQKFTGSLSARSRSLEVGGIARLEKAGVIGNRPATG